LKLPFPLPLTPFEFNFLCEHRPKFPSIIPITIEASGKLDRAELAHAYERVHQRHPLLAATVEQSPRGWPYWVPVTPVPIRYVNGAEPQPRNTERAPPGLELHVREDAGRICFDFVFSHVAVDGLGAFQVIADLFLDYAGVGSKTTRPRKAGSKPRAGLGERDAHCLTHQGLKLADLLHIARIHLPLNMRPAAVVSGAKHVETLNPPVAEQSMYRVQPRFLGEQETTALANIAALRSVTLNDLMLRDYFLTIAEWNRGTAEARRPLRILVPTDLRKRRSLHSPAANMFSYAFLTRREAECRDREQLLNSIREETAAIKREKRGLYYEAGLRLGCRWPGMVRWRLKRNYAFATAVFTNLGASFDRIPLPQRDGRKVARDLVFHSGAGLGPLRPKTRVSFALSSYGGRLAISANCDQHALTPGQQQALLEAYVANLRTTIASET
jgi:hypothetical protein